MDAAVLIVESPDRVSRRPLELLKTERRSGDARAELRAAFVGRERELADLTAALEAAAVGRGSLYLLTGEPGIGKTRLVEELCATAAARGTVVVRSRCWEGGGAPALWPWIALIRAVIGRPDLDPTTRFVGEELLATIDPGEVREEPVSFSVLDAIASFFLEVATWRPLLIAVDDLHAADPTSLRVLSLAADRLRGAAAFVVGTFREAEGRRSPGRARSLAELARQGPVLALPGLDERAIAAFVEQRLGTVPAPESVAAMADATGGNPFFLEQLLSMATPSGLSMVRIPAQVREAVRWRLEPLDDATIHALRVASVVGRSFEPSLLAALLDEPVTVVLDGIATACDHGLLSADGAVEFVHSLVRETLYEDLLPSDRRRYHEAVAALLEERDGIDGPSVAAIAHHRLSALPLGDRDRAIEAARRAAERASRMAAYDVAVPLLAEVTALLDESGAPARDRCVARLRLGEAQRLAGDTDASRTTFLGAVEMAPSPRLYAMAALGVATGLGGFGFVDRADAQVIALLERALGELGPEDSVDRARLLGRLAIELYYTSEAERRDALSREAVEVASRVGHDHTLLVARYSRTSCQVGPDDVAERRAVASDLTDLALELNDLEMALRATHLRLVAALEDADMVDVDRALERYERLVDQGRRPLYRWHLEVLRTMRAIMSGDLLEAEHRAHAALDLGLPVHGDTATLIFGVQLCSIRWMQGRIDEVEPAMRVFVEQYPGSAWRPALLIASAQAGHLDETRAMFDVMASEGFDRIPRDGNWLTTLCHLSIPCAALGDADRAADLLALLEPYAGRVVVANAGAVCYGSVSTFLGLLAMTTGDLDTADRHFEAGLVHNLAIGHRPLAVWTLVQYGDLLVRRGELGRARAVLSDARSRARSLGLDWLADRADELFPEQPAVEDDTRLGAQVFRREGDYWTVHYEGQLCRLRDGKGPRYLATLLANPGQRIPALELAAEGSVSLDSGSAGPAIDARARAEYAARLQELEDERREATEFNDLERVARVEEELDAITAELRRAIGLGGRARPTASPAERARVSVTKVLKQAIRRIAQEHPALGRHLDATVRTGTFCVYLPDPGADVNWEV